MSELLCCTPLTAGGGLVVGRGGGLVVWCDVV